MCSILDFFRYGGFLSNRDYSGQQYSVSLAVMNEVFRMRLVISSDFVPAYISFPFLSGTSATTFSVVPTFRGLRLSVGACHWDHYDYFIN